MYAYNLRFFFFFGNVFVFNVAYFSISKLCILSNITDHFLEHTIVISDKKHLFSLTIARRKRNNIYLHSTLKNSLCRGVSAKIVYIFNFFFISEFSVYFYWLLKKAMFYKTVPDLFVYFLVIYILNKISRPLK